MTARSMGLATLVALLSSCAGSTGGDLFSFTAAASGPVEAVAGEPLRFDTPLGFHVVLDRARLHVGGVYLNLAQPRSAFTVPECYLPGVYTAQVTRGLTVDALSPDAQPFPGEGEAIEGAALTAEVWLTGGAIDAAEDATVLADVAGVATRGAETFPFEGQLTIGSNRLIPVRDPALPGANPLCKQRIVSPIAVALDVRRGGALHLRVDPRRWFTTVDFAALAPDGDVYPFLDRTDGPSGSLYAGLRATSGPYVLTWTASSPAAPLE